jgi:VCBS repeat-containing protein
MSGNTPAIITTNDANITVDNTSPTSTVSGTVTHTDDDIENDDDIFINVTNGIGINGYGSYTIDVGGTWVYTLNNTHNTIIELLLGQTKVDIIVITSEDGTEKNLNITINGIVNPDVTINDDTVVENSVSKLSTVIIHMPIGYSYYIPPITDGSTSGRRFYISIQGVDAGLIELIYDTYDTINKTWIYTLQLKNNNIPIFTQNNNYIFNINVLSTYTDTVYINKSFNIDVIEQNYSPTSVSLFDTYVKEIMKGAVVSAIRTNDNNIVDPILNLHTYIISGTDAALFEITLGNILKLKDNIEVDFETKPLLTINIQSILLQKTIENNILSGSIVSTVFINVTNQYDTKDEQAIINHATIASTYITQHLLSPTNILDIDDSSQIKIGFYISLENSTNKEFRKVEEIINNTRIKVNENIIYQYYNTTAVYIYDLSDIIINTQNIIPFNTAFALQGIAGSSDIMVDTIYDTFNGNNIDNNNAVCHLYIPESYFKEVFLFMTDNINTNNTEGLIYAVDLSKWNRIPNTNTHSKLNIITQAVIEDTSLIIQTNLSDNKHIYFDYVRYMSKIIIGNNNTGLPFENEMQLRNDIKGLDNIIYQHIINILNSEDAGAGIIGGKLGDTMNNGAVGDQNGKSFGSYSESRNNLSREVLRTLLNGNRFQQQRIHKTLENYNESNKDEWIDIPIITGDIIKFTIKLVPMTRVPLGINSIPDKLYNVHINIT